MARPGDRIDVPRRGRGRVAAGEIAEVLGSGEHEHYLVRWDDGHVSVYYPRVEPRARRPPPARRPDDGRETTVAPGSDVHVERLGKGQERRGRG